MNFLIDSNILIYAANRSLPQNKTAVDVLNEASKSNDYWCITWQNIFEFVSIVTNKKVFENPIDIEEAVDKVNSIFEVPNIKLIIEGEKHWKILVDIINSLRGVHGAFIYDCRLAAIMKENEISKIITADEAFRRFSFLKVENPFKN